jgi:hypothetical protein
MSKLAFNRDGGKTDEYGTQLWHQRIWTGEVAEGCAVVANASPSMGVRVQAGTLRIPTGTSPANYWYEAAIDTASPGEALTVTTANPSNPRRDLVVAYIDKGVTPSTGVTNNSNNVLKLAVVAGTAAASPSDPNSSAIQTAIGASNPYIILARIRVATSASQITNSDIDDLRTMATISTSQLSGIGAWTDFSGSIGFSNFTLGNGSVTYAKYKQIGKTVDYRGRIVLGSTSSFSGSLRISLPVNMAADYQISDTIGNGVVNDVSASLLVPVVARVVSVSTIALVGVATQVGANPVYLDQSATRDAAGSQPIAFTTGDIFQWQVTYEAA